MQLKIDAATWRITLVFVIIIIQAYLVRRLQSVQNAAARLVFRLRRSDHITDALVSLHWLRVQERITFKVAVLTYRALHDDAPQYLRQFTSIADIPSRQRLRSSTSDEPCAPVVRLPTIGHRVSLSPMLAYGTTYRLMSPQHYLCSSSENDLNCICFDYRILA